MKIVSIVGARPQFIKVAPVSKEIRKRYVEILIHTGQHYDYEMSKLFFDELKIPEPDYHLGVGSANHAKQTGQMLIRLEEVLFKERPDLVLVYGDTNSTLAGALAVSKLNISVAHVEAGMRSFNRAMPEEINRVLTDHLSSINFCSTQTACDNLKKEGIEDGVYLVGDVMIDMLIQSQGLIKQHNKTLDKLGLKEKEYFFLTLHRASNTDIKENLNSIISALLALQEPIVFPVHPRAKKALETHNLEDRLKGSNLLLIPPVSYVESLRLIAKAKKILTDSGGIQKEAYFLKVPCISLREETEWVETVKEGANILVGADSEKIIDAVRNFQPLIEGRETFGNGKSSVRIAEIISDFFIK